MYFIILEIKIEILFYFNSYFIHITTQELQVKSTSTRKQCRWLLLSTLTRRHPILNSSVMRIREWSSVPEPSSTVSRTPLCIKTLLTSTRICPFSRSTSEKIEYMNSLHGCLVIAYRLSISCVLLNDITIHSKITPALSEYTVKLSKLYVLGSMALRTEWWSAIVGIITLGTWRKERVC